MSDSQQSIPKRKESNSDNDRSDDWEKSPTVYSVKRQRMRQGKNVEISPRTDLVSFAKQNNTLTRESKDIVQITPTEREPWSVKRSRGSLQVKVHQIQQNYLQKINQESNCFPEPVNDNYSNQDLFITNDQTKGEQFISKKWKQASQLDNQSDDSMFGPDFKLEDLEALDLFEKELGIAPQQNPAQNQENKDVDNGSNGNNKNQNLNYDNDNDNDNDNDDYMFGDDFPLEDVENLLFDLEEGVHKEPTSAATGTGGSGVAFSVPFEKIEPIFKVPEPSGLSSDRLSIINNSQSIQVSNSQPSQESKNLSVQGDSNQKVFFLNCYLAHNSFLSKNTKYYASRKLKSS
ncbi:hypothetical protein J3Q64DRAFT_1722341 [Phycomyces blakesleeanus]|uniref:Uncharacterized protein n=1 Tax=Phycomyces blakesleeanus TaxID=4837 RepID=A0ABR3BAE3_PHYBL